MLDLSSFESNLFTDAYRRITNGLSSVEEPDVAPYGSVREDLVRCIWFGGHHRRILTTEDGSRLEVLSPGWWNVEAGPDFRHAEILLERKGLVKGDVEIHVHAKDWKRHGHDKNPAYNSVVLHVCLRNDSQRRYATSADGTRIPQLCLEKHLDTDLAELQETIPLEDYPDQADSLSHQCQKRIRESHVDDEWLGKLLDYAGDERILAKARRFQSALQAKPFDQVLYEGLMEGLGYKSNSAPFLQLSRVCTLSYLRSRAEALDDDHDRAEVMQAALFGVANLLPKGKAELDDESQAYVDRLREHWATMANDFVRQVMDADVWQFSGTRPVNYPSRRIGAISRLLSGYLVDGIGRSVLQCFEAGAGSSSDTRRARAVLKAIDELFVGLSDPYWDFRYGFGGKRLTSSRKLVGRDRALILVVNILVPILLQYAREHDDPHLEERVHSVYRHCRKLAPDSVTRFMAHHLFGGEKRARLCITGARRQQGVHQVYKDFCKRDDTDCSDCVLLLAIDAAPGTIRST